MILPIRTLGDAVLRTQCRAVANILSAETQNIVRELIESAHACDDAAGLAAPQIGFSEQVFVIATHLDADGEDTGAAPAYKAIINPQFLHMSDEMENGVESCFSIPDKVAVINRHQSVKVRYFDQHGQQQVEEMTGYIARVFQHEYDHLGGIVYLDRVVDKDSIMTEEEYMQFIADADEVVNNPEITQREGLEKIDTNNLEFDLKELDAMLQQLPEEHRENLVKMLMEGQENEAAALKAEKKVLREKYYALKRAEEAMGGGKAVTRKESQLVAPDTSEKRTGRNRAARENRRQSNN